MSDMLDKEWEIAHVQEFTNKQRDARRYNFRVVPRDMKEGDLVLRQVVSPTRIQKILHNQERPNRGREKLPYEEYKLGNIFPKTYNSLNLRH